jgi:hypothetical protein
MRQYLCLKESLMKCPHCGNESNRKDVCSRCREKMEMPEQMIEVEYKEFKVSEFMEIRKKKQNSGKGTGKAVTEGAGAEEEGDRTAANAGIPATHVLLLRQKGKRRIFFIAILVFVVLAVITGAYYLLRFLHHR